MKNHTDVYRNFWWDELTLSQTEQCAVCSQWGADVHHISNRGSGGSKCKDYIENLICLCRSCHDKCHKDKSFNNQVRIINLRNIADKLEEEI
jgi:hypothetical protein